MFVKLVSLVSERLKVIASHAMIPTVRIATNLKTIVPLVFLAIVQMEADVRSVKCRTVLNVLYHQQAVLNVRKDI
jgi:hypothetical protein